MARRLKTETRYGSVVTEGSLAYYVPDSNGRDPKLATVGDLDDDVVKFSGHTGRKPVKCAELWAGLVERTRGRLGWCDGDGGLTASKAKVPVLVAAEGKPSIAAFLAAHDHRNSAIASVLDVGERTVSQYITDFQKGER